MAIIKNQRQDSCNAARSIIPTGREQDERSSPSTPPDPVEDSFPVTKKAIVVIAIGLTALVLIYLSITFIPQIKTLPEKSNYDSKVVSLDLEKMTRIGGLIDLLENKIVQTEHSLAKAKQLNDKVLIDTFRLGLARNLDDLTKHKEEFVAGMILIHQKYTTNPDLVTQQLKQILKKSQDVYQTGNEKTINTILTLIKSVPEETKPSEYFKEKIMSHKVERS